MTEPTLPASASTATAFWCDEADTEDLAFRILMGEPSSSLPPRPTCNLHPEFAYPPSLSALEQIARRPVPTVQKNITKTLQQLQNPSGGSSSQLAGNTVGSTRTNPITTLSPSTTRLGGHKIPPPGKSMPSPSSGISTSVSSSAAAAVAVPSSVPPRTLLPERNISTKSNAPFPRTLPSPVPLSSPQPAEKGILAQGYKKSASLSQHRREKETLPNLSERGRNREGGGGEGENDKGAHVGPGTSYVSVSPAVSTSRANSGVRNMPRSQAPAFSKSAETEDTQKNVSELSHSTTEKQVMGATTREKETHSAYVSQRQGEQNLLPSSAISTDSISNKTTQREEPVAQLPSSHPDTDKSGVDPVKRNLAHSFLPSFLFPAEDTAIEPLLPKSSNADRTVRSLFPEASHETQELERKKKEEVVVSTNATAESDKLHASSHATHPASESSETHVSFTYSVPTFSESVPPNEALVGSKREKASETLLRLRNQSCVDPDLIFGTANYEVPLKRIFAKHKEASLFVNTDNRGISGDWCLDHFDADEEIAYKKAVGITVLGKPMVNYYG